MKRLLLAVFFLVGLLLPARAADKANTILIHPGETIFAHFEAKGKKLKLISFAKEKNEGAQVVFSLQPDAKKGGFTLKVENKFTQDLTYQVEMRSLTAKRHIIIPGAPVVGGKVAFENYPQVVEELAAYDFRLEK